MIVFQNVLSNFTFRPEVGFHIFHAFVRLVLNSNRFLVVVDQVQPQLHEYLEACR